jgi:imidazolonepropionase
VAEGPDAAGLPQADILVEGAAQVLTMPPEGGLGVIEQGVVAIGGGRVMAVGDRAVVRAAARLEGAEVVRLEGGVLAPGYVDSHTHVVFGGSRVAEYVAAVARDSEALLRLMDAGQTGILATVDATRTTPVDELLAQSLARVREMLRLGTTTIESKSGYGLERATEIAQLEVNRRLTELVPVRIVSTFLGAHAVPRDIRRDRYIDWLTAELIPEVAERRLATFCDVYCDVGYYTATETRRILEAGEGAGLRPKIHIDAYSHTGGAQVAADLAAVSADHLDYTTAAEAEEMAAAGVTGVLMPGLDFAVGHTKPFDARMLAASGLPLALATDICPGCWMPSMTLVIQLACRSHHLSVEEAIRASTIGGARALGLEREVGSLQPGFAADLQAWDLPDYRHLAYRLGSDPVRLVIRGGRVVVDRRGEGADGGQP